MSSRCSSGVLRTPIPGADAVTEVAIETSTRLAVWGDPVSHSRSPQLHSAAYRALGLDWSYTRRQVAAEAFSAAITGLDGSWRGLSLTMPLKEEAFRWAHTRDRAATLTGAVNTLLVSGPLRGHGFNTDIAGLVAALREGGLQEIPRARILGAGATAASAILALAELGATRIDVVARRPEAVTSLRALGEQIGVAVDGSAFDASHSTVDVTIATLPSGIRLQPAISRALGDAGGALFDVAYAPWPSALAEQWTDAPRLSGIGMLLHQAVVQVRIFLHGDPLAVLDDEEMVVAEMRAAVMGD